MSTASTQGTGETGANARAPRKKVTGIVTSAKMAKTISVRVSGKVRHPVYGKYVVRHEVYKAHDETGKAKKGDTVQIAFARRLSKTKFWTLVKIVSAARVEAVRGEEEIAAVVAPPKAAPTASAPAAPAAGAGEVAS